MEKRVLMTKQRKAALLAFVLAAVFVALQFTLNLQSGIAGVFVMGMAGGLLVGDAMERETKKPGR